MKRENLFRNLCDEVLAKCYRQYIHQMINNGEIKDSPSLEIYEQYKNNLGDKYAKTIMYTDLLHEIGFRWCNIVEND